MLKQVASLPSLHFEVTWPDTGGVSLRDVLWLCSLARLCVTSKRARPAVSRLSAPVPSGLQHLVLLVLVLLEIVAMA